MDWRVAVIDENRFCIVGTMDLTFDECSALSDRMRGNMIRIPMRTLTTVGSFEARPSLDDTYQAQVVRGANFYKRTDKSEQSMLHVVVRDDRELDGLRRTGRFREWDADLRVKTQR